MSDDAARLDHLARALGRAYDAAVREALADRSLTRHEHAMLAILCSTAEPLAWDVVERRMPAGLGAATITGAWEGLVASGRAEEVDGLFAPTLDGRTDLADIDDEVARIHREATANLSGDEVAITTAVLERLLANLED